MRRLAPGIAVLVLACAGSSRQEPAPAQNAVTREEITESGAASAYDAIQSLRPTWLQAAKKERLPFVIPGQPAPQFDRRCAWTVYIGERGFTQDALHNTAASQIREIRLIPARAPRPDGSRCDHDSAAIHVLLTDQSSGDAT